MYRRFRKKDRSVKVLFNKNWVIYVIVSIHMVLSFYLFLYFGILLEDLNKP